MGKLIEGKGYFARFVCVEFSLVPSISSDKVVVLFPWYEKCWEGHLHKGNLYSTLKQIEGRQSTFNQLPSVQNNPMPEWYILAFYTLNLFGVEIRVQSEAQANSYRETQNKFCCPLFTLSSQIFIQIPFVHKGTAKEPSRGKGITQG